MHDGLRDQHPIERIRVEPWQPACEESGFLIDVQ